MVAGGRFGLRRRCVMLLAMWDGGIEWECVENFPDKITCYAPFGQCS